MKDGRYTKNDIAAYLDDTIEENWTRSCVNEFGYLLRVISEEEVAFFSPSTIPHIYKNVDRYINNIDKEFLKEKMMFERVNKRSTVEGNLNDLKDIFLSIKAYYDDAGFSSDSNLNALTDYSNKPPKRDWKGQSEEWDEPGEWSKKAVMFAYFAMGVLLITLIANHFIETS